MIDIDAKVEIRAKKMIDLDVGIVIVKQSMGLILESVEIDKNNMYRAMTLIQ